MQFESNTLHSIHFLALIIVWSILKENAFEVNGSRSPQRSLPLAIHHFENVGLIVGSKLNA